MWLISKPSEFVKKSINKKNQHLTSSCTSSIRLQQICKVLKNPMESLKGVEHYQELFDMCSGWKMTKFESLSGLHISFKH